MRRLVTTHPHSNADFQILTLSMGLKIHACPLLLLHLPNRGHQHQRTDTICTGWITHVTSFIFLLYSLMVRPKTFLRPSVWETFLCSVKDFFYNKLLLKVRICFAEHLVSRSMEGHTSLRNSSRHEVSNGPFPGCLNVASMWCEQPYYNRPIYTQCHELLNHLKTDAGIFFTT